MKNQIPWAAPFNSAITMLHTPLPLHCPPTPYRTLHKVLLNTTNFNSVHTQRAEEGGGKREWVMERHRFVWASERPCACVRVWKQRPFDLQTSFVESGAGKESLNARVHYWSMQESANLGWTLKRTAACILCQTALWKDKNASHFSPPKCNYITWRDYKERESGREDNKM